MLAAICTIFPPLWKNCRTPPHTKTLSDADGTFRRPLRLKLLVDTILTVSLFPVKPHRSTIKLLQTSARSGLHRAKSTQGADITSTGAARFGNCIPVMWRQFSMKQNTGTALHRTVASPTWRRKLLQRASPANGWRRLPIQFYCTLP